MPELIWVFGSNRSGRHGLGAALEARLRYGAQGGVGEGRTGYSYAIPTKGYKMEILPLEDIEKSVAKFVEYATQHPELEFLLTEIGCGLARGQMTKDERRAQIAPLFKNSPSNVIIPKEWEPFL